MALLHSRKMTQHAELKTVGRHNRFTRFCCLDLHSDAWESVNDAPLGGIGNYAGTFNNSRMIYGAGYPLVFDFT